MDEKEFRDVDWSEIKGSIPFSATTKLTLILRYQRFFVCKNTDLQVSLSSTITPSVHLRSFLLQFKKNQSLMNTHYFA